MLRRLFGLASNVSPRSRMASHVAPEGVAAAPLADDLNADLSMRVLMRTSTMAFVSSGQTATVERKRCFRAGDQERGAVTSVVRYLPGAAFPAHPHPQGEEIYVLEGIFSDARGDHGAGTLLLNPEGWEHAPHSAEGNTILVRLRQYPSADAETPRAQLAVDAVALAWADGAPGVSTKLLYPLDAAQAAAYPERQWLEKWAAGAAPVSARVSAGGHEVFVVEGGFSDSDGDYAKGDWLRLPAGHAYAPTPGEDGCTLLCKSGGLVHAIPAC
ncbi:ChrR cupin-like domain-containing protein [Pelagophyceae sp. CCMP2097]|nr:ChrR cupin-like domain-containing protein [Pelagophyceae sp. CCMP2097]